MGGTTHLLLAILYIKHAASVGSLLPRSPDESDCCAEKTVGGVSYTLVKEADTSGYNCLANCIYQKKDGGGMFCFAAGNLEVVCGDDAESNFVSIQECPAMGVNWIGPTWISVNASTWEKCGNICYESENCAVGWTWYPESNLCNLYNSVPGPAGVSPGAISGHRSCPVEDCDHSHFSSWWAVVSPCFKKRIQKAENQNVTIYNPELCESEPNNKTLKAEIDMAVKDLATTVHSSTNLTSLARDMWLNVPTDYKEYCPGDFDSLIVYLKVVATITPPFLIEAPNYLGVPISTVLLCFLHTEKGRLFFATPAINNHIRKIVNLYGTLLKSPDSLTVFNDLQYGWMSKCSQDLLNMTQYVYEPKAPNWGYKNFNEFFTRNLSDIKETRPCDTDPYVLTAFGDVASYHNQTNVTLDTNLYLKNESYSLQQIFNNNKTIAKEFVGGAIMQVFFSAHKYHRYHSPVSGTIVHAERVPGIVYAIDKVNALANNNFTNGEHLTAQEKLKKWIKVGQNGLSDAELYLAHAATRCIFVIDSGHPLGKVGIVLIGMVEISSCIINKQKGDVVEKGEELGMFQFGGSSGLVILQEKTVNAAANKGPVIVPKKDGSFQGKVWKMCEKMLDLSPYELLFLGPGHRVRSQSKVFNLPELSPSTCSPPAHPGMENPQSQILFYGYVATVWKNGTLLCGGYNVTYLDTCYRLKMFSHTTGYWISFPPMQHSRLTAAAAWLGKDWWVTGGYTDIEIIKSTEILSPNDTWSSYVDLPEPVRGHCLVNIDSTTVFLCGGSGGGGASGTVSYGVKNASYIFTPGGGFVKQPNMLIARHLQQCTLFNGEIWVAGGEVTGGSDGPFIGTTSVESFSLTTSTWTTRQAIPKPIYSGNLLVIDGRLVLIGGEDDNQKIYQLENNNWFEVVTLSQTRSPFAALKWKTCTNN